MTDDNAKRLARHLEFLGYTTNGREADGWWRAEHPRRWNIAFLPTPLGARLHCSIHVSERGALHDIAWHRFVSRFNEDAIVARMSLSEDAAGHELLRVRTLLPPAYERRLYGALLDAWHSDLEFMQHAPASQGAERATQQAETTH